MVTVRSKTILFRAFRFSLYHICSLYQVDSDLFDEEHSALERDVFSAKFLSSRGWRIMRVWSRDWWHDSKGVISAIVETLRDAGISPEPKARKKKTENE